MITGPGQDIRLPRSAPMSEFARELAFWDPDRWQPRAVLRRCRGWINATRRRRWTVWTLAVIFVLFVFPGVVGAVATAQNTSTVHLASSTNSALGTLDIRDSSGVEVSKYLFAANRGSLWNPGNTVIALVLNLEFAGWLVLVTVAIWLIGYALSFQWLNLFASALQGVADAFTGQIATPIMMTTAAAIGAFFVAWFIVRGRPAKATAQVVTMVAVAIIGPVFLADPLAEVLSEHGLLAQGRDVGISVAAGLNGNSSPNPRQLVVTMQETLADNFARRPLQVWNFGHVVDDRPACGAAWSSGVMAGDEAAVRRGMGDCGDTQAKDAADNPSVGQIGAGLLLAVCAVILLGFGSYFGIRIMWDTLEAFRHLFQFILGLAAGAFIYGPTQTFTVRSGLHGALAGGRVCADTVFLGLYILFLGNLLNEARNQVVTAFVICAIVLIIAILQLHQLNRSLTKGSDWVANRFALAIQGDGGGRGSGSGGSGGGTALGMGTIGAGGSLGGLGILAGLAAVNTVGASPATEWAALRTRTPLRPFARKERAAMLGNWGVWGNPGARGRPGFGGPEGWYTQSYLKQEQLSMGARTGARGYGGIDTFRGAAAALQGLEDVGGNLNDAWGAMAGAGFTNERIMFNAIRSWGMAEENAEDETLADKHLGHVVAAMARAQHSARQMVAGCGNADETAADFATLQAAAFRYMRANAGHVTLDGGAATGVQRAWVTDYMRTPTEAKIQALQTLASGGDPEGPEAARLAGIQQVGAARMMQWIGNEHAHRVMEYVERMVLDPSDGDASREARRLVASATDTDQWASGVKRTPWNSLAPPGIAPTPTGWGDAMMAVADRLR